MRRAPGLLLRPRFAPTFGVTGGGGLVTPTAWLDPADLTPGAVASWVTNGVPYEFAQATGGSQPVMSATSLGGSPGVTFDGSDDKLVTADTIADPTGSCSVMALIEIVAFDTGTIRTMIGLPHAWLQAFDFGAGSNHVYQQDSGTVQLTPVPTGTRVVLQLHRSPTLADWVLKDDQGHIDPSSGTTTGSGTPFTSDKWGLGAKNDGSNTYTNFILGWLGWWDTALTGPEAAAWEAYLQGL